MTRKKVVFSYGISQTLRITNFKNRSFRSGQNLFKSDQTWRRVSPLYLVTKTKRICAVACVGKKIRFSYRILRLFRMNSSYWILKIGMFHWVKELSKPKQTRYGVSPSNLESKTKRTFAIACLWEKLVFHTEICECPRTTNFINRFFDWVKKLFKSDQNWYVVCPMYLESKTK